MNKKTNTWRLIAFFLLSSLLLATTGCTQVNRARSLVIIASDQPGSADPAVNWTFGGGAYLPHIYESLFRFVGESAPRLEPVLALEIPSVENGGISFDGLVYTIRLQPKARFQDGSPVNADAVVYSYQRIQALNRGPNGISAQWIERVEKVDDQTVRFRLTEPFSDFLNSLGSVWGNYIVNPKVVSDHEQNGDWGNAWLETNGAGSGPYRLKSYDTDNNIIVLTRDPAYWGGWSVDEPVEQATIRWLRDPSEARLLYERGEADVVVNMPANDFAALEGAGNTKNHKYPGIMQYYLGLNGEAEPLQDVRVRRALQHTFNTARMIEEYFGGNMLMMDAAVGPGYPDVYAANRRYTYDLERARQLLREAGYDGGFELIVNVLHFWPNDTAVLEAWQADLAQIGVRLNLQEVDHDTWNRAWFEDCAAADMPNIGQISTMAVGGDYPSAWEVIAQVYPTPRLGGGRCSAVYLDNPFINGLNNRITETTDPGERATLFQDLYNEIAADAGAIWIGQAVDLVTMRSKIQGYHYSFSMGGNFIPLAEISLAQ